VHAFHACYCSRTERSLQTGKTRWTHYQIAYHFVWIPKYRRRILTGAVQKACKELVAECCERNGLSLLAQETDQDTSMFSYPHRRASARRTLPICSRAIHRDIFGCGFRV